MTEPLRWGILSTAAIGTEKVIPAIQAASNCRVVAIASRGEASGRAAADRLGIPTVHVGYEALLADPEVEAIYNPLPNHLHAEWTIAAARAGKHVLCEKPLALDAAEAATMIEACDAAGVVLMEAFMYRLHPSWVAARELVAAGRIGRLRFVQSRFTYFNDDAENIRNIPAYGGGALYDVGCYCINSARLLFDAEPEVVGASIDRDPRFGTDVLTSALLRFPGGHATFSCSTQTEPDQRVHAVGDAGRIEIEIPFNIPPDRPARIFLTAGGDPPVAPATEVITFPAADQYQLQAEGFADAVRRGTPPPIPTSDAVDNLRVLEAVFAAAQPGGTSG
jgi:predicted dehydrogenase